MHCMLLFKHQKTFVGYASINLWVFVVVVVVVVVEGSGIMYQRVYDNSILRCTYFETGANNIYEVKLKKCIRCI